MHKLPVFFGLLSGTGDGTAITGSTVDSISGMNFLLPSLSVTTKKHVNYKQLLVERTIKITYVCGCLFNTLQYILGRFH